MVCIKYAYVLVVALAMTEPLVLHQINKPHKEDTEAKKCVLRKLQWSAINTRARAIMRAMVMRAMMARISVAKATTRATVKSYSKCYGSENVCIVKAIVPCQ